MCSLTQKEEERALIDALTARLGSVDILDVAAVVNPEVKALGDVVNLRRKNLVGLFEFEFLEHLGQGCSFGELLRRTGVLAVNLNHFIVLLEGFYSCASCFSR